MTFPVSTRDPGTLSGGRVTKNGELIVSALDYSKPYYASLIVDNAVYNVVPAKTSKLFITTGMFITTSKAIVGEKTVQIYEALAADSSTHEADIVNMDMVKSERATIPIANSATDSTRWINAQCDDSVVNITIWGYYVDD